MPFGQELREQRESLGISLDEVSVSTRVSLRHLQALEGDRYTDLPGGVFNRGIVRSYANFCGLDVDETVRRFQDAMRSKGLDTEGREDDWRELAEAVHRSRVTDAPARRLRWLGVAAMLLIVLALAAGVLWVLVHRGIVHLPEKKWVPSVYRSH
ncbi:helix-turn-helix domain-containing protein [Terriglobus sp. ADX1]|uniref:helix-turn-helix domain-containing protein n=1 Tax=Terriglobus sp. ADX1 TaxID=2794063 RepID=UPI002FE6BEE0